MTGSNKIALLSCCAPCSTATIMNLKEQGADFCVLFFNPNIYPESEFIKRQTEQIAFCKKLGVKVEVLPYNHNSWLKDMAGLESEPERGARCSKCFAHRFELGCVWAKNNSFDTIASVFGVSKFKDQTQVDNAGIPIAAKFGLKYITAPDDEQLRYKLSKDLYRQKYCGCEFSIRKLTPNT